MANAKQRRSKNGDGEDELVQKQRSGKGDGDGEMVQKQRSENGDGDGDGDGDGEMVQKFIASVAQQLISDDGEDSHLLPLESSGLNEVLLHVTNDLPPGKLRSALLPQGNFSTFVAALRDEIEARKGVSEDSVVAPFQSSSGVLLSAEDHSRLAHVLSKRIESLRSNGKQASDLSLEVRRRLLMDKDPPLNVLWITAALEISHRSIPCQNENESSAALSASKALLRCLKPMIIGHKNAYTAVAALAPVVPLLFQAIHDSLQSALGDTNSWTKATKALQAMIREILSFIVVCRKKEKYSSKAEALCFPPLLDAFSLLLGALELEQMREQSDVAAVTKRIKHMFPLISKAMLKRLERPGCKIDYVSRIVVIEFVQLQLILELMHWRNEVKTQEEASRQRFMAAMRTIAVHGVAAADHGNDLLLNVLLSGFSVGNMLDDKEVALISIFLFEALLAEDRYFVNKPMVADSTSKGKICSAFLKRMAVARNANHSYRLAGEQSSFGHVLLELHVPVELVQWLKMAKLRQKVPEKAMTSPQILIGWLLNLQDIDFKEIYDRSSKNSFHATPNQEVENLKGVDVCDVMEGAQNYSSRDVPSQVEPDHLFFVDTKGEAEGPTADMTVWTGLPVKKTKKKKDEILFDRCTHVADGKASDNATTELVPAVNMVDMNKGNRKAKKRRRK